MAQDPANGVGWYLSVDTAHRHYLGAIRHWGNLKVATEEGLLWVRDFTAVQVDSVEVKSIPYKQLYYAREGRLFLQGSLLPDRPVPSVLWTPIERALPLKLPAFNHNYFGVADRLVTRLAPSGTEKEASCLLTDIQALGHYIETAPAIRLKHLSWVMVGNDQALVLGRPLLPIEGAAYWRKDDFLLPAGFDLELPSLVPVLNHQLNAQGTHWVIWDTRGRYHPLSKDLLRPLSISSFRRSINQQHEPERLFPIL